MHYALVAVLLAQAHAGFLAAKNGKVQTEAEPVDHAAAAQASAAEAQQHLEAAKQAYNMTKANVKEIHATGKKIENTADKIKDLYGGADGEKAKGEDKEAKKDKDAAKEAPEGVPDMQAPTGSYSRREQEEAGRNRLYQSIAQIIFAILYWFLIVKHYPSARELPPPNQAAKELQAVDEVTATCHTSFSNLFLAWCCTGPRAAHTFYSVLGFNYWVGAVLTSCFPCCTLWYFNSFTDLNQRLGGEKRSALMGLVCACFCSCCVIAQDAEALDKITGLETNFCSVRRAK